VRQLWYWIPAVLVLVVAGLTGAFLPADRSLRILTRLLAGLVMVLVGRFPGIPYVVTEDLEPVVHFSTRQANPGQSAAGTVECCVPGVMTNKTPVGRGSVKDLCLRVSVGERKSDYMYIPSEYGRYAGYRFEPNSRLPVSTPRFVKTVVNYDWSQIEGREARIILDVVGQPRRVYKRKMSDIMQT